MKSIVRKSDDCVTVSTEEAASPKSDKSRKIFLGISQYKFKSRFWFNSNLYKEFEFFDLDLVDFGGVAFSVETVLQKSPVYVGCVYIYIHVYVYIYIISRGDQ